MAVIGLDCDGVLAEFTSAFVQRIIDVTGRDLFGRDKAGWDEDFPPVWDFPQETYGYTDEEVDRTWKNIRKDAEFWLRLKPLYGASEAVRELDFLRIAGHDIYFVTARPGISAKRQTEDWLEGMGMHCPTVILGSDKGAYVKLLKMDAYIDDRLSNANQVMGTVRVGRLNTRVYLYHAPYNDRDVAEMSMEQYAVAEDLRDPALIPVRSVDEMLMKEGLI